MRVGVHDPSGVFRDAIAELPAAAAASVSPHGAIAVVSGGAGWPAETTRVIADGAIAVVVSEPAVVEPGALAALVAQVRVPLVIARHRLRADVAAEAASRAAGRLGTVVEASAGLAQHPLVLQDAIGWGRTLAGGRLALVAAARTATAVSALFDHQGLPVTLQVSRARTGTPVIRALTLGPARVAVTVDEGALAQRVESVTADGALGLPTRWEAAPRVALRRAIASLAGGERPDDLDDLVHDARLADELGARVIANAATT
jgi:hypothetical protein